MDRFYPFRFLPAEQVHALFLLDAFLGRRKKLAGPNYHTLVRDLLENVPGDHDKLWKWIEKKFQTGPISSATRRAVHRKIERCKEAGIWACRWKVQDSEHAPCPEVLFGCGPMDPGGPCLAVFNSRKSKRIDPDAEWLRALRSFLQQFSDPAALAASIGTLTYDLLCAHALDKKLRLLLVIPFPLEKRKTLCAEIMNDDFGRAIWLTCQTLAVKCGKATRMVCRDRLLARIADTHLLLEIRKGGNLHGILRELYAEKKRNVWALIPQAQHSGNEGTFSLLENLPDAKRVAVENVPVPPRTIADKASPSTPQRKSVAIKWDAHLYHYTRARPGPWLGQTYLSYLLELLENAPLCGHSALDTLIRILKEGVIKGSTELVRGREPVVSWTATPPSELASLVKWNPALIRWTFEPYGIAVDRRLLKEQGARPVVYGPDHVYARLPASQRFRFQRHEPPRCSWKHEKEWRLLGDFEINLARPDNGFVFVLTEEDAKKLTKYCGRLLPIIVLSQCTPLH